MLSRCGFSRILLLGVTTVWPVAGQTAPGPANSRDFEAMRPSGMPATLQAQFRALGRRLQASESARVTYGGVLRDNRGARPIEVTIQNPGLVRIAEGGTGARVTSFDGERVLSTAGPMATEQQQLLETLALDSPESVFQQLASGEAFRRIGGGYQVKGSGAAARAVEFVDVFQLFPRGRVVKARPAAAIRLLAFDTSSLLLKYVSYREAGGKAVSTQFEDWKSAGTERYPGRIRRMENGVEVFSIEIQTMQLGGRLNPSAF